MDSPITRSILAPAEGFVTQERRERCGSGVAPADSNMGAALRAKGQVPDAIASYERALALQPDYPEAHYNLANALLDHKAGWRNSAV